jgi:hypothetical protein
MSCRPVLLGLSPLLLAACLVNPSRARAAGVVLITHGTTVNHVADIPAEHQQAIRQQLGAGVAIGYTYSYFGVFWLDLWTWGGEYCLFRDKTAWKVPRDMLAQIAGKSSVDELGKPFLYKFPLGLIILLGILFFAVPAGIRKKTAQRKIQRLFADPRYQKALNLIAERVNKEQAAVAAASQEGQAVAPAAAEESQRHRIFDEAVQLLVSEGIDQLEAEQNLALMLHILSQAHRAPAEAPGPAPKEEAAAEAASPPQPGAGG